MAAAHVYFAYGSNLHPVRLRQRCPSARLLGTGQLPGWRMEFRKRGRDGSAKGDAVRTGRPKDRLCVAAYALTSADKARLDVVEGLGQGYREETARAVVQGANCEGFLYVAEPDAVPGGLTPFEWYRTMVVAGAAFHGFPDAYVEELRAVPAVPDPDARRATEQWRIVAEIALSPGVLDASRSLTLPSG